MQRLSLFVLSALFALPLSSLHAQAAAPSPGPAFSSMISEGDTVYVSGSLGRTPTSGELTTTQEAEALLTSIKNGLAERGMSMDDLVTATVFCTDLKEYDNFNRVYRTFFHAALPARAFIGVNSLLYGSHFEMMGVARKGAAQSKRATK